MTKAEIISSILDQARDKDTLANGEADSVFAADARALREAAELLKSVSEWVSSKTAVPADTRLCLIATHYGMGTAQYFGEGAWIAAHDAIEDEVMHWHEMPKEWIPASEKLPEKEGQYLVARDDKIYCLADYDGDGEWMTWDLCNITRLVTKWAVLPDYQPGEEENDD